MFQAKTQRISDLANRYPNRIRELELLFFKPTNIYIDFSNVRPWSEKLKWNVDPKRTKQFLDSFSTIKSVNFYTGELRGDEISEDCIKEYAEVFKNGLKTKPVKIMKLSIDISSISPNDPAILKDFIRKPLLEKLNIQTIEALNSELGKLNKQGIYELEDRKCNFDVEIGTDMLLDLERNNSDIFVLWSGDSDFSDPIAKILGAGKLVYLFATARRVSTELSLLRSQGLIIFDIQKIKNFICWKKEIII